MSAPRPRRRRPVAVVAVPARRCAGGSRLGGRAVAGAMPAPRGPPSAARRRPRDHARPSASATSRASSSRRSTSPTRPATTATPGLDVDVPEQDRPRPRHARRAGRHRHRHRRRHERHPGRQPGHPDPVRRDDLRPVPVDRVRQGVVGHHDRRRPQGQEARHPGQVRLVLDHAPGAARVGRADARRRDDRRVPGLRPGRRGRSRARSTPRPGFANNEPVQLELAGTTTSPSSTSTTSRRCRARA